MPHSPSVPPCTSRPSISPTPGVVCAVFRAMAANGQIVYEPLLWAIALASHCTVHTRSLDSICRHCARSLSQLGVFSRPGYCELCDGWLGESDTDSKQARPGSATAEEQVWSSTQVEVCWRCFRRLTQLLPGSRFAGAWLPISIRSQVECPCLGTAYSVLTQHSPELAGRRACSSA